MLNHTSIVILRFRARERLYGTGQNAAEFFQATVPLYAYILECQAHLLSQLSKRSNKSHRPRTQDREGHFLRRIQALETDFDTWARGIPILELAQGLGGRSQGTPDVPVKFRIGETAEKLNKLRRRLYSNYEGDKERNPDRVLGTCEWFLGHVNFLAWREKVISALLWVSGDPGCGKSVLSRHIINHGGQVLASSPEPVTVCYFFFKDGDSERRFGLNALRAILSQLLLKNPALFGAIEEEYDRKGEALLADFDSLWEILLKVAGSPGAGEIICVLDALDECEPSAREYLIRKLVAHYSDDQLAKNRNTRLKFIVTSRPYPEIEDSFHVLTEASASIRLVGEDQSAQIGTEIDLVIEARIPEITHKLDPVDQALLISQLKKTKNRTYLWLSLIFEVIGKKYSGMIKRDGAATARNLRRLIEQLPYSVEKVYKELLDKGDDPNFAKQLLLLIVGAYRPLTIQEIDIALAMDSSWDAHWDEGGMCESESELGRRLSREDSLRTKIKESCGLLVIISDSRLYLIHQTVREYLLSRGSSLPPRWQSSFDPRSSHRVLARLCISYIMFPEFLQKPPKATRLDLYGYMPTTDDKLAEWDGFLSAHPFLDYASNYWPAHLRGSGGDQREHAQSLMTLCEVSSPQFSTWYEASKLRLWRTRRPPTSVYVAASLGIGTTVEALLGDGFTGEQDDAPEILGQAMFRAAEGGFDSIVKLLLSRGANSQSSEGWALIGASYNGFPRVVELLLDQKLSDINISARYKQHRKGTPLYFAASQGHLEVVRLLLERGAVADLVCEENTAMTAAANAGHRAVVQALLEAFANPSIECRDGSAIVCAAKNGFIDMIELLLAHNANVNGGRATSPLVAAVKGGYDSLAALLLHRGAYINERTEVGTALTMAVDTDNLKMAQLLLDNGAVLEFGANSTIWNEFQRPLDIAATKGYIRMMELLLDNRANVNHVSSSSLTAVQWAVAAGLPDAVQFLLNNGADLDIRGALGTTLHVAAETGRVQMVQFLLNRGADINEASRRSGILGPMLPPRDYDNPVSGSALQRATILGKLDVVRVLCERGADVNATSEFNRSFPLHIALDRNFRDIAVCLMQCAVDWDKQGAHAFELMIARHYPYLVEDLFEKSPDVVASSPARWYRWRLSRGMPRHWTGC